MERIKKALISAPLLAYFDTNAPVSIQCDASDLGFGACVLQRGRPIAYTSRPLTDAERNQPPIENELLAVVDAMTKFNYITYA